MKRRITVRLMRCSMMSLLGAELLALCEWATDYYRHPLGEVVAAALPGSLKHGAAAAFARPQRWQLTNAGRIALANLPTRNRVQRAALEALADGGRVAGEWNVASADRKSTRLNSSH